MPARKQPTRKAPAKKPAHTDYHKKMLADIRHLQDVWSRVSILSEPNKERHLTGDESDEQILNYLALNNVKDITYGD